MSQSERGSDVRAAPVIPNTPATVATGRRARVPAVAVSVALLPVLFMIWYLTTSAGLIAPILLPAPAAVLEAVPEVLGGRSFPRHMTRTVSEIVIGFVLGGALGFGLGLLLGSSARLRRAYLPFLSALQAVPKVILAPLIIAWFGFGISGKIAQAALACFYAVFITTLSGLELADADAVRLLRSLQASTWQVMRRARIPSALPAIFGGLQIGATTAIIGAIVSEFVGADAGLGFLMLRYRSSFDTASVWVLIGCFLLFGVVSYLLLAFAERRIVFWRRPGLTRADLEQG